MVRIGDIRAVVIEGRKRPGNAAHNRHRMGVAPEPPEKVIKLFVQHRVIGDAFLEFLLLIRRRQLAIEQQIADLHEVGLFRQHVDGITPIKQDPFFAVDEGNFRFTASRRRKAGIIGETVGFRVQLPDVDDVGTEGAFQNRQFIGFSRPVVGKRKGLGGCFCRFIFHRCRLLALGGVMATQTVAGRRFSVLFSGVDYTLFSR